MKLTLLLLIVLVVGITEAKRVNTTPSPYGTYRVKLYKCDCNKVEMDKFFYPNYTCFAKAVNRDVSTMNFYYKLKKDVSKGWVTTTLQYKYGTIFRDIFTLKKVEACGALWMVMGDKEKNPLLQTLYMFAKLSIPDIIHVCPYKV